MARCALDECVFVLSFLCVCVCCLASSAAHARTHDEARTRAHEREHTNCLAALHPRPMR